MLELHPEGISGRFSEEALGGFPEESGRFPEGISVGFSGGIPERTLGGFLEGTFEEFPDRTSR